MNHYIPFFIILLIYIPIFAVEENKFIPPQLISMPDIQVPDSLKHVEGEVICELLVDEQGIIEDVSILTHLHPIIDSLVITQAEIGKFTPGSVDGVFVAATLPYQFRFALPELSPELTSTGIFYQRGTRQILSDITVAAHISEPQNVSQQRYLELLDKIPGQITEEGLVVTTSDSLGLFSFYNLPEGEVTFTVMKEGFKSVRIVDTIVSGKVLELNFFLRPLLQNDYEVVTYYNDEPESVTRRQLNRKEAASVPGSAGDPLRAIHSLPGVARPSYGSGEVVIRGARPEDSRFYLDGMELPRLFHPGEIRTVLPAEALAGLDFYPGAFGAQFGNVTGGVVVAESRRATTKRLRGSFDLNSMDMGIYLEGPLSDKVSMAGSFRVSDKTGLVKWYVGFIGDDLLIPTYLDYMARLDISDIGRSDFSVQVLGSRDTVVYSGSNNKQNDSWFNRVQTNWMFKFNQQFHNKLSYGYLSTEKNFSDEWGFTNKYETFNSYEETKRTERAHFFSDHLTLFIGDRLNIKVGVQGELRHLLYDINSHYYYKGRFYDSAKDTMLLDSDTTLTLSRNRSRDNWNYGMLSPWAQFIWQVSDPLLLVGGIRYDYYKELIHSGAVLPEFGDYPFNNSSGISAEPSLRLAARYDINDNHTLKAALGNYNQTPQPRIESIDSLNGDPTLPTTKAAHYTLGYEWRVTDLLSLDVQGYYNSRWDIPQRLWDSTSGWFWSHDIEGRSYGLELFLRHQRGEHFAGWVSYTLSRSEETDKYGEFNPAWTDQTHNLLLTGSWYLPKEWELGGKLQATSGVRYSPLLGVEPDTRNPIYGEANSQKTAPAFKVDLRAAKQILAKKVTTTIYLDVQNALYPLYKSPEEMGYNGSKGSQSESYMVPIPSLGVMVQF